MSKTLDMGKGSILKLLVRYSVPAVLAMLVGAVYNIVDRIFIGQYVGEKALAGVTVDFPLMLAVMAIAAMVEAGSSSLIAIELGKGDKRQAGRLFGNSIGLGIILSGLFVAFLLFNLSGVIDVLGAEGDVAGYAFGYMKVILMGVIVQVMAQILGSAVRVDGFPMLSMIAMVVSAVVNIVLDYVFIYHFKMGVEGAALATIIGQSTGFVILSIHFIRGKSSFEILPKDFIVNIKLSLKAMGIGVSTLVSVSGMSIAMLIMNVQLLKYGDASAVTAIGIINGLYSFFIMPIMGIQQGMQPILGYNYGSGQLKRVFKTLKTALLIAIAYSSLFFMIVQLFPMTFVQMFISKESATADLTVQALRIVVMMLPLLSVNFFGIALYQSIGEGRASFLLSILRQFYLFVPALMILPKMFGLTGVWFAQPIADGLSIAITFWAIISGYKKLMKREQEKLQLNLKAKVYS